MLFIDFNCVMKKLIVIGQINIILMFDQLVY